MTSFVIAELEFSLQKLIMSKHITCEKYQMYSCFEPSNESSSDWSWSLTRAGDPRVALRNGRDSLGHIYGSVHGRPTCRMRLRYLSVRPNLSRAKIARPDPMAQTSPCTYKYPNAHQSSYTFILTAHSKSLSWLGHRSVCGYTPTSDQHEVLLTSTFQAGIHQVLLQNN